MEWDPAAGGVRLIDQTRLPQEEVYRTCRTTPEVADAIRTMVVRGAPAIGAAAGYGAALAAGQDELATLRQARPTARDLIWAVDRVQQARQAGGPEAALDEAHAIASESIESCRAMGHRGAHLLPEGARIITICNTGALAAVDYGTALGVVRAAHEAGKRVSVLADETRPFLQGSRLTTWELREDGIPVTLITDGMAGHLMQRRQVDLVIVGADRIAANGDVANKIGTYGLAVLAKEHGLPFYVAAPVSTFDLSLVSGDEIPIEERDPREVTTLAGRPIAPDGTPARHPAFDVTPARLVTAIITEAGIARPPTPERLRELAEAATAR